MHQQQCTHPVTVPRSIPKEIVHAPPSEVSQCAIITLVCKDVLPHSSTEPGHGPNLRVIIGPVHAIRVLWRDKNELRDTVHSAEQKTSSCLRSTASSSLSNRPTLTLMQSIKFVAPSGQSSQVEYSYFVALMQVQALYSPYSYFSNLQVTEKASFMLPMLGSM